MIERLKAYIKECFSNSPTAKNICCVTAVIIVSIIVGVTITSMRKTITLSIDGRNETIITYKRTVKDVLQGRGINLGAKDNVQPSLEANVSENDIITLKTPVEVTVTVAGTCIDVDTAEYTVEDMLNAEKETLKQNGIEFVKGVDEITPALDEKIEKGSNIQIVKVQNKEVTEKQIINFDTIIEDDPSMDISVQKVKSEGSNGEKEVTYNVVYKDGEEVSREIKSTKTIAEPKNKLVVKGTGQIYASRGAGDIAYKKKLNCIATAYSGGTLTATGSKPVRNVGGLSTIAVDPSFIPLGSKVYVEGYGYAIAADTGGVIKGNKIDLYLNSSAECFNWGVQHTDVLLIAYPGEW